MSLGNHFNIAVQHQQGHHFKFFLTLRPKPMIDNHLRTNLAINHNHNEFLTTSANGILCVVDFDGCLTTTILCLWCNLINPPNPHYHDVQNGRWCMTRKWIHDLVKCWAQSFSSPWMGQKHWSLSKIDFN